MKQHRRKKQASNKPPPMPIIISTSTFSIMAEKFGMNLGREGRASSEHGSRPAQPGSSLDVPPSVEDDGAQTAEPHAWKTRSLPGGPGPQPAQRGKGLFVDGEGLGCSQRRDSGQRVGQPLSLSQAVGHTGRHVSKWFYSQTPGPPDICSLIRVRMDPLLFIKFENILRA